MWKIQEDIRTANDTKVDKVTEAIVEGLQKRTVYVLRVLGTSMGGDGKKSEKTYFTVLGKLVYMYLNFDVDCTHSKIIISSPEPCLYHHTD